MVVSHFGVNKTRLISPPAKFIKVLVSMMKIDFNKLNIFIGCVFDGNAKEAWENKFYPLKAQFFCAATREVVDADYFKTVQLIKYGEGRLEPKQIADILDFVNHHELSPEERSMQREIYEAAYEHVLEGRNHRFFFHEYFQLKNTPARIPLVRQQRRMHQPK